jgi:hypothetical protein
MADIESFGFAAHPKMVRTKQKFAVTATAEEASDEGYLLVTLDPREDLSTKI